MEMERYVKKGPFIIEKRKSMSFLIYRVGRYVIIFIAKSFWFWRVFSSSFIRHPSCIFSGGDTSLDIVLTLLEIGPYSYACI